MSFRLWLGAWIVLAIQVSQCASQSFHPLGFLPGADQTFGDGITADGTRVFGGSGQAHGLGTFTPAQWTSAGGLAPLAVIQEGQRGTARDVSANGATVVGQITTTAGMEAFRWTASEGLVPLGDLESAGVWSFGYGVSDNGQTVVGSGTVSAGPGVEKSEAFRWTANEGMQGLGFLPDKTDQSFAYDVSGDGAIIVGFSSQLERNGQTVNRHEAFRWTEQLGMVGLGDLPGGEFGSIAEAISANGQVIVGGSGGENGTEAFCWTAEAGMVALGMLPSESGLPYSDAYAVSADGTVIVGTSSGHAAVWDQQHGFRSIATLNYGQWH